MSLFDEMIHLGKLLSREADLDRQVRISSTTYIPGAEYGWRNSRPDLLARLSGTRQEIADLKEKKWW